MTDKELLEFAAKAAEINLEWDGVPDLWQPMFYKGKTYHSWEPLTDDGDALRLAVKLEMCVSTPMDNSAVAKVADVRCRITLQACCGDRYAATRRAIVRAAAELGKAIP